MCKSYFGEEFPIFTMLERLFRRAVRSEADPNALNHNCKIKGQQFRKESQQRHSCSTVKIGSERLPTGDGMVLVFTNNPEAPVECALEISKALQSHPKLKVRMGIQSGPVNPIGDVNDQSNLLGAGINLAQRVMYCGDSGHILLSKHFAENLEHNAHLQTRYQTLMVLDSLADPEIVGRL
jgi:hypothetical protein